MLRLIILNCRGTVEKMLRDALPHLKLFLTLDTFVTLWTLFKYSLQGAQIRGLCDFSHLRHFSHQGHKNKTETIYYNELNILIFGF